MSELCYTKDPSFAYGGPVGSAVKDITLIRVAGSRICSAQFLVAGSVHSMPIVEKHGNRTPTIDVAYSAPQIPVATVTDNETDNQGRGSHQRSTARGG